MDTTNLANRLADTIRDQWLSFILLIILLVASFPLFQENQALAILVLVAAFGLFAFKLILDYRNRAISEQSASVVLALPRGMDPEKVEFQSCEYERTDPRNGGRTRRGRLVPIGPGPYQKVWTCRLPPGYRPTDSIRLELTDADHKRWIVSPFVPANLYSPVQVRPPHP
jgi:hypothetical protein